MKKRKIIIPALLTIAACTSVAAGATYALFTSESAINIAVTSGKVDVVASVSDLEAYSPTSIQSNGTVSNDTNVANNDNEEKVFANGGTVKLEDDTITLANVTAGDKITFNVNIKNNSTVKAKYRILIGGTNDNGLFEGLNVSFDAGDFEFAQNVAGITAVSKYVSIDSGSEDVTIPMTIELPTTAGNEYQGKACQITCKVEAVQGNADSTDAEEGTLELYSATDLVTYSKLETACGSDTTATIAKFTTIELMNDIDMTGIEWTPIIGRCNTGSPLTFGELTFEGNNHTISNLSATETLYSGNYFTGFFGRITCMTIQNLNIDNSNFTGTHYVGGIVGQALYSSNIINCSVKNSILTSTTEDYDKDGTYDNGDKVGGIVGQFNEGANGAALSNCTVDNCIITGYRDLGGLVGYAGSITVSGNTVKNTTITSDHTNNYKGYTTATQFDVNEIIGESSGVTASDNTSENVTVNNEM